MKTTRAFTLIELMVVISIISMLASVVLAAVKPMRAQARDIVRTQEVHQMDLAVQQYISDKGHPPEWVGCDSQAPLTDGTVSGCIAVSTAGISGIPNDGKAAWNSFVNEIKPYMPSVPADPCVGTGSCTTETGTQLGYTYIPPAVASFYSGGSNNDYQLSAGMEVSTSRSSTAGPFTVISFNVSLNPMPGNGPATFSWLTSDMNASCKFQTLAFSGNSIDYWFDGTAWTELSGLLQGVGSISNVGSPFYNGSPMDNWALQIIRLHCTDRNGTEANSNKITITNSDWHPAAITSFTNSRIGGSKVLLTWITQYATGCEMRLYVNGTDPAHSQSLLDYTTVYHSGMAPWPNNANASMIFDELNYYIFQDHHSLSSGDTAYPQLHCTGSGSEGPNAYQFTSWVVP
jgi:prepilin-type N-terminal cleavage/methylation domain-containing protein